MECTEFFAYNIFGKWNLFTHRCVELNSEQYASCLYCSVAAYKSMTRTEADFTKRSMTQKHDLNKSMHVSCTCTLHTGA